MFRFIRSLLSSVGRPQVRSMFVRTEETPNPNSLKFFPGGKSVTASSPVIFDSSNDGQKLPRLAKRLFGVSGVNKVNNFYSDCLKSVIIDENCSLKTHVRSRFRIDYKIRRARLDGSQLIDEEDVTAHEQQDESDLDEISKQIKALLNEKVRPIIVNDGGDIQFVGFNDGIVSVKLKGACVGCPSSTITLKNGIENMLKFYIPEVEKVEDISASNTNSLDEHDFMLKMPKKDGN
ncbi:hypothetical protein ACOME3_005537 [Neoechinorhynchus agilis]